MRTFVAGTSLGRSVGGNLCQERKGKPLAGIESGLPCAGSCSTHPGHRENGQVGRTPHAVGSFNPHRTRRGDGVSLPDLTSKEVGVHRRGGTWPLSLDWSLRHGARAPAAGPRFVTSPCAWLTPSVTTALKHGPGLAWRHQGSGGRCVAGTAARADAARAPLDSETQNVAPPP